MPFQSVAFFSAVDIDHVLRKEPNMTCLTPSHEEKISEGVSCTLLDTINQLSSNDNQEQESECLLGNSIETDGLHIKQETVVDLLGKLNPRHDVKGSNLPFLKAQMYKNYRTQLDHSWSGNRATETIVRNRRKQ